MRQFRASSRQIQRFQRPSSSSLTQKGSPCRSPLWGVTDSLADVTQNMIKSINCCWKPTWRKTCSNNFQLTRSYAFSLSIQPFFFLIGCSASCARIILSAACLPGIKPHCASPTSLHIMGLNRLAIILVLKTLQREIGRNGVEGINVITVSFMISGDLDCLKALLIN